MVKKIDYEGKTYYQCEICLMYYESEKFAKECEDFCKKFKSCNVNLIKHAVKLGGK